MSIGGFFWGRQGSAHFRQPPSLLQQPLRGKVLSQSPGGFQGNPIFDKSRPRHACHARAGLLRIFTPNSQIDTKEDWTGETAFAAAMLPQALLRPRANVQTLTASLSFRHWQWFLWKNQARAQEALLGEQTGSWQ